MLSKGQGRTMGSYFTLLNALAEDGRLDEAEEFWNKLFSQHLESMPPIFFYKVISLYYDRAITSYLRSESCPHKPTRVLSACFVLAHMSPRKFPRKLPNIGLLQARVLMIEPPKRKDPSRSDVIPVHSCTPPELGSYCTK
ncbi:pentatricopeptide repeat-containing protein At4g18975, chloroplastic-like [Benincasa hispida]|uniref:pentatricopeptide repeat-containing protein At4g18975, chloroplastic-like n=1 Tax=Benincasa hispida TaxID=102211 RepID=UPI0018FFE217|nr:pentatricopeptide repeat-containing protein At4g18975, chloroplastic-like [Benincasa hispida]